MYTQGTHPTADRAVRVAEASVQLQASGQEIPRRPLGAAAHVNGTALKLAWVVHLSRTTRRIPIANSGKIKEVAPQDNWPDRPGVVYIFA